jgi:hypothetical protein
MAWWWFVVAMWSFVWKMWIPGRFVLWLVRNSWSVACPPEFCGAVLRGDADGALAGGPYR